MKYLFLKGVITILFCCGCSRHNNSSSSVTVDSNGIMNIHLDALEVGSPFDFYDLFESYERILNVSGEQKSSGSWTRGIRYGGGETYILNDHLKGCYTIHRMDTDEEVGRIGKVGINLSDGEYAKSTKMEWDLGNNRIYILSAIQGAVLRFNGQGKYLGYFSVINKNPGVMLDGDKGSVGKICDAIRVIPDSKNILIHYAYWDGNRSPFNFGILDTCGGLVNSKKTFREFNGYTKYFIEFSSYIYQNKLHVCDLADTLYIVDNNQFIPKYIFTSKHTLEDVLKNEQTKSINLSVSKDKQKQPPAVYVIMENNTYLFFRLNYLGGGIDTQYFCYLNKKKKIAYKLPAPGMPYTVLPDSTNMRIYYLPDKIVQYQSYDGKLYKFIRKD